MSLYIIMMGVQGAGKGVQARMISETYNIPHVSTGDIFRAMKTRDDDLAREVQAIMKSGALVSDEVTCRIVEDRLNQSDAAKGVILDGFPRNEVQAQWLDEYLGSKGEAVTAVLSMELDLYVAFKRAFGRVSDSAGNSYNIFYNTDGLAEWAFEEHPEKAYPPRLVAKTDSGEEAIRRPDDANAGAIVTRIDTYLANTMPLLNYYESKGVVVKVDADQAIDAVAAAVRDAINARTQV